MSINCGIVGVVPDPVAPDDEVQVTFDISAWLDSYEISSVAYSAVDASGRDVATTVLDDAKHSNTTTVIKPFIKGGGSGGKRYTIKCIVTTNASNSDKKTFYIKFKTEELAP